MHLISATLSFPSSSSFCNVIGQLDIVLVNLFLMTHNQRQQPVFTLTASTGGIIVALKYKNGSTNGHRMTLTMNHKPTWRSSSALNDLL